MKFILLSILLLVSFSGVSVAAFVDDEEEPFISVEHTGGALSSGGEITLTLKVNQPTNAYFIGLEVAFDPNVFEYLVAEPGDEFESGMVIADMIGSNRIGVSVTRTDRLNRIWSGDALEIQFKVKDRETDTQTTVQFLQLVLTDLYGTPIPSVSISPMQLAITSEPDDSGDPGDPGDDDIPAPDPPDRRPRRPLRALPGGVRRRAGGRGPRADRERDRAPAAGAGGADAGAAARGSAAGDRAAARRAVAVAGADRGGGAVPLARRRVCALAAGGRVLDCRDRRRGASQSEG